MAYLVKPFQKKDLLPAIEMAASRFAELVTLEREVGDLTGRLEARKVVDRRKGRLQSEQGMSEPEAFRLLQRRSMDTRRSMRAVAQDVLDGAGVAAEAVTQDDA
jgi:response regulator NasT